MREVKIAPSVLSVDYSKMEHQCADLNKSAAAYLHFDVMDGHFVPNLTFGVDVLKGFKKACPNLVMDVHLMVEHPEKYVTSFKDAGADIFVFHVEACENHEAIRNLLLEIKANGMKAGLVIKPKTDVHVLDEFLELCDLVLIMSVEPGFGGQSFMEDMLDKVRYLRQVIDEKQYNCEIEIDGGINAETAKLAKEAGVDVLVAGSYVFKGDIVERVQTLI